MLEKWVTFDEAIPVADASVIVAFSLDELLIARVTVNGVEWLSDCGGGCMDFNGLIYEGAVWSYVAWDTDALRRALGASAAVALSQSGGIHLR